MVGKRSLARAIYRMALEQFQPEWKLVVDKSSGKNKELERAAYFQSP
jgi:hypothetical protein